MLAAGPHHIASRLALEPDSGGFSADAFKAPGAWLTEVGERMHQCTSGTGNPAESACGWQVEGAGQSG
jgi:hypothetical protein